jgi:UDP-N-acetylmuramyl pentapeptide phosphotransferase/UDP-N-acetylglucosamine-1-phosphate transferase
MLLSIITSYILLFLYSYFAKKFGIVDTPSERRLHKGSVSRGCGVVIAIFCTIQSFIFYKIYGIEDSFYYAFISILGIFLFVSLVFFIEDIYGINRYVRLVIQATASIAGTYAIGERAIVVDFLPYFVNFGIVSIGWIWFMNMFNFMDGVDGMTSTNSLFFIFAILFFCYKIDPHTRSDLMIIMYSLFPMMVVFLIKNWHPAKMFVGDSGSIGLGFLFGYGMITLQSKVGILIPTIICSYYLSDSVITIIKRIINKEDISQPHCKHYFQIAIRGGLRPRSVIYTISILNLSLFFICYLYFKIQNPLTFLICFLFAGFANMIVLKYFRSFERFIKY